MLNTLEPQILFLALFILQEWIEENEGSSLLETLYGALDEVSLL